MHMCIYIYIIHTRVCVCVCVCVFIERAKKLIIRSIGRNSLEDMFKVILKLKCITDLFKHIMRLLKK